MNAKGKTDLQEQVCHVASLMQKDGAGIVEHTYLEKIERASNQLNCFGKKTPDNLAMKKGESFRLHVVVSNLKQTKNSY